MGSEKDSQSKQALASLESGPKRKALEIMLRSRVKYLLDSMEPFGRAKTLTPSTLGEHAKRIDELVADITKYLPESIASEMADSFDEDGKRIISFGDAQSTGMVVTPLMDSLGDPWALVILATALNTGEEDKTPGFLNRLANDLNSGPSQLLFMRLDDTADLYAVLGITTPLSAASRSVADRIAVQIVDHLAEVANLYEMDQATGPNVATVESGARRLLEEIQIEDRWEINDVVRGFERYRAALPEEVRDLPVLEIGDDSAYVTIPLGSSSGIMTGVLGFDIATDGRTGLAITCILPTMLPHVQALETARALNNGGDDSSDTTEHTTSWTYGSWITSEVKPGQGNIYYQGFIGDRYKRHIELGHEMQGLIWEMTTSWSRLRMAQEVENAITGGEL